MTIWTPKIGTRSGPLYLRITDALGEDVLSGRLKPKEKLPTHRELAEALGVTVTTVSRAYAEAERRGLISGEVGRGTFVRSMEAGPGEQPESPFIDLSVNSLFPTPLAEDLTRRLAAGGAPAALARRLDYHPHPGAPRHRAAGAAWLKRRGLEASTEHIILTAGAQNAMAVAFLALARPGDVVLTEAMTYQGMKVLAHQLHLRLVGVTVDDEGLEPAALRAAARKTKAHLLYTMPTVQNPLSVTMSEARRREIASVARACNLTLIEDDTYGFIEPRTRPLSTYAPDRSVYLTGVSKSLAPALRIGFVHAAPALTERLVSALFATVVEASPLTAELVSDWVEDGTADRVAEWKRVEIAARQALARSVLTGHRVVTRPSSPHLLLHLPSSWRTQDFVEKARTRGVLVSPGAEFAVTDDKEPKMVRICLGPPRDRGRLENGLRVLAEILARSPELYVRVV